MIYNDRGSGVPACLRLVKPLFLSPTSYSQGIFLGCCCCCCTVAAEFSFLLMRMQVRSIGDGSRLPRRREIDLGRTIGMQLSRGPIFFSCCVPRPRVYTYCIRCWLGEGREYIYTKSGEREREKIARGDLFLRPMSARRPAVVLAE